MTGHFWHRLSLRAKGLIVALIPLAALLLSSLLFYTTELEEQQAQQWVTHTLEVRSKIQQAHTQLEESETHLRGYFLIGAPELLKRSFEAQSQLEKTTRQLYLLVRDNATQLARVQRVSALAQHRRTQSQRTVNSHTDLVRDKGLVEDIKQNRKLMEALRHELTVMRIAEEKLNVQRDARVEEARASIARTLVLGILVGIVGGLGASFVFTRGIDFRVQKLNRSARALAQGEPMPPGEWNGNDAIESLGRELGQTSQLLIERQNKLHEANEYLNYLNGAMPGVLIRLDKEFRPLYVSPNAERIFGYSLDEIFANPQFYSRTLHPEDRDRIMQDLTRAIIRKDSLVETQRRVLHKSGEYHWMHSYVRPEYDENGNVIGLLSYSVDVSDLKHAQEALVASEALFRNSFDFAPIGITLMSLQGEWMQTNRAMCEILGYSEAEFMQLKLEDITHSEDFVNTRDSLVQLLNSDTPYYEVERRYIHRDGHTVWVQVNVSLVRNIEGQPLYYIGQVQDISQRKTIETQLAQARDAAVESARIKANFMANMSHEIRTPMNGIIGMLGLLSGTPLTPTQDEYLKMMRESADALLVIINDILDFSKIEAGKLEMEKADFDLNSTIESILGLLATKSHARGIELGSLVYREVPTLLRGDAGRLRQILLNLLDNAIKFTPSSGETMLRVTREDEDESHVFLRFTVSDSGIGIEAEVQQQLFQPFAQADGSTTRRYGGTGLGLAISKQLVELMGGQIGVNSKVGKGSTFWFTARFEKQSSPLAVAARLKVDMSDCRVLIVDSNATHRRMVQQQVASWNFSCDSICTGADAIEMLHREIRNDEPYHVVIVNGQLEDMEGLQLAKNVRSQPSLAATRLVMMVAPDDDTATILASGVNEILPKPIRQSQLFNCLTEALEAEQGTAPNALFQAPALLSPNTGPALHILVAEDNAINQKVVLNQLLNLGHTSVVVSNGKEAVEEWQRHSYSLILMDCHMPEMDGYSASRQIRQLETPGQHIPIIALTANALKGDRERCLEAGMDDYLSKPLKQEDLEVALQRWSQCIVDLPATAQDKSFSREDEPARVDLERLEQLQTELSPQLFCELVQMFLADVPQLLRELNQVWEQGNACEVREIAHKIKSVCVTLGATHLAVLGNIIQELAENEAIDQVAPLLPELEDEFGQVEKILGAYTAEPPLLCG